MKFFNPIIFSAILAILFAFPEKKVKNIGSAKQVAETTLAILPAEVRIRIPEPESYFINTKEVAEKEVTLSIIVQNELNKIFQDITKPGLAIQRINLTDSLLEIAANTNKKFKVKTEDEIVKLAEYLHCDKILFCSVKMDKPENKELRKFLKQAKYVDSSNLRVAFTGSIEKATTNIYLHDGRSGKLLWEYNEDCKGKDRTPATIVEFLFKNIGPSFASVK